VCLLIRVVAATVPDRVGHARAVTFALTAMMTGLAALFVFAAPAGVFVGAVILAIGISFQYPGLMAMVVDVVPEHERVRAIATFTMFFEIGTACGGLTLGALADFTSKRSAFAGGAAFCAVALIVLWRFAVPRMRRHVTV
jgi:MFS family permease